MVSKTLPFSDHSSVSKEITAPKNTSVFSVINYFNLGLFLELLMILKKLLVFRPDYNLFLVTFLTARTKP